ncbi:MAG: hypothetical protein IPP62_18940 [bacterium]|nr:hypothetical protein [bacterium]
MRQRVHSVLAFSFALGLAALAASAAPAQTVVSLVPPSGYFQCGQTWTIDVTVDAGATDLRGCSLVIAFDNNVIRPLSVSAGALVTGAACPNFTHWFGPATADSVAVDGPPSVARWPGPARWRASPSRVMPAASARLRCAARCCAPA